MGIRGERYSRERDLADYVLEPFGRGERAAFEESIERAAEALRLWLTEGIDAAMRHANPKPSSPEAKPLRIDIHEEESHEALRHRRPGHPGL